ncbi:class I SAM-dependent methyltransferase [Janibacter sp. GXQ6167]|uniref:class I SAM-dependent methyltransferase n=1 Tax=Janibacter sp. GXQ6167 TaxID=3240791 RepID=UPI0035257190
MTTISQPICLRRPSLEKWCLRRYLAQAIVGRVLARVPVRVVLPGGRAMGSDDPRLPEIEIVDEIAAFERLAHHPKIGLGEAYMAGEWRAAPGTDLVEVLQPFAERMTSAIPPSLLRMRGVVDRAIPRGHRNTLAGSRRNIEAHYDLSNDLFEAFLDPSLMYSSALFDDTTPWAEQSLEEAQYRKVGRVLDLARVGEGSRVLEIGTGWGALAIEAARRGAQVTTLTLSREQAALAQERIDAAGLTDRIDVRIEDYRESTGQYDAVVSVEMIEAVGEEYWPAYFATIDERLAPGGVAVIQAILMAHERYLATRRSYGWIQKHIFPGGLIPSEQAIEEVCAEHTSLRLTDSATFGQHYAHTLRRWRQRFDEQWPQIAGHGFDEEFRRKWEFYLAYCEAGFAAGYLDVAHLTLTR